MGANEEPQKEAERAAEEGEDRRPGGQTPSGVHEVPLFLRGISDGRKGDAQDEKDETGE
jgi:hypothetical protein